MRNVSNESKSDGKSPKRNAAVRSHWVWSELITNRSVRIMATSQLLDEGAASVIRTVRSGIRPIRSGRRRLGQAFFEDLLGATSRFCAKLEVQ
jgi:hypothetical protein